MPAITPNQGDSDDRRAFKLIAAWLEPLGFLDDLTVVEDQGANVQDVHIRMTIHRKPGIDVLTAIERELQARGRRAEWTKHTGQGWDGYVAAHEPALSKKELDEMLDLFDPATRAKIELDAEVEEGVKRPRRRATKIPRPKTKGD